MFPPSSRAAEVFPEPPAAAPLPSGRGEPLPAPTISELLAERVAAQDVPNPIRQQAIAALRKMGTPESKIEAALSHMDLSAAEPPAPPIAGSTVLHNPNPKGVPSEGMIARRLAKIKADVHGTPLPPEPQSPFPAQASVPTSDDDLMAQLQASVRLGKEAPGDASSLMKAANQDPNMKRSLIDLLTNERGSVGTANVEPPPFPDRVSNPTDPYREITQSAGPETPELARVKLLRKTLGMKGQGGLPMLIGAGGAAGGGLTLAELLAQYAHSKGRTP